MSEFQAQKPKTPTPYGHIIGILLVLVVFGGFYYVTSYVSRQNEALTEIKEELALLEVRVEELVSASEESTQKIINEKVAGLTQELESAREKTQELEQELKNEAGLSAQKIAELEESLSNGYDLVSIISGWRARTPLIRCRFDGGYSTGSGILVSFNEGGATNYYVVTNRHVLVSNPAIARDCTIEFPDGKGTHVAVQEDGAIQGTVGNYDLGRLKIVQPDAYIRNTATSMNRFCSARPSIGDEVISIGYPLIGSTGDITATDGIISGFESDYFITSAKIERGNSGGIVVLLKNNCLLGVSTFVQFGQLESLARILDINVARTDFESLTNF